LFEKGEKEMEGGREGEVIIWLSTHFPPPREKGSQGRGRGGGREGGRAVPAIVQEVGNRVHVKLSRSLVVGQRRRLVRLKVAERPREVSYADASPPSSRGAVPKHAPEGGLPGRGGWRRGKRRGGRRRKRVGWAVGVHEGGRGGMRRGRKSSCSPSVGCLEFVEKGVGMRRRR